MNLYLSKRKPPIKLADIVDDFKNGPEQMAKLLEILCGCRIDTESGRTGFRKDRPFSDYSGQRITFTICQITPVTKDMFSYLIYHTGTHKIVLHQSYSQKYKQTNITRNFKL